MSKVALLILFNHNYEKNLSVLDKIYQKRFDNIWYIMPFYQGDRKDVITVYENSYYFQAYIAKALEKVYNNNFDHYLIIGDDLLINPNINQNNYQEYFSLNSQTGFIPGMFLLNNTAETRPDRPLAPHWIWIKSAIEFRIDQPGILVSDYLPTYEQAKEKLAQHGLTFESEVSWKMFFWNQFFSKNLYKAVYDKNLFKKYKDAIYIFKSSNYFSKKLIKYPLVGSYSDIVIVPRDGVSDFVKYCGIFGALNLFVEIALPTALSFSTKKIISEDSLKAKGCTFWNPQDISSFEKKYDLFLPDLINNFPDDVLYVHPVKFSRWKTGN